ncbi:MAG: hypothetical protein Q7T16_03280 [Candidatus Burarchaeum sp.]|nr:hypothetical protein [Candidatus Burarchaeum sp.]MDO8339655.1 hypothetical protein [Candidatus Burarchaeum sp.]
MAETTIRACPLCGNDNLKWLGGGENAIFDYIGRTALSNQMLCEKCQERVFPIEFDSKVEYQKFLKALESGESGKNSLLSEEEKELQTEEEKLEAAPSPWFVKLGGWLLGIGLMGVLLAVGLTFIFGGLAFLILVFLVVFLAGHLILYVSALYLLVLPSNKNPLEKLVWAFFLLLVLEFYYIMGYKFTPKSRPEKN